MAEIPVNRQFLRMQAASVTGNLRTVGEALVMGRTTPIQVGYAPINQVQRHTVQTGASRVGAFCGALSGLLACAVLGAMLGAAAGPVVAVLLVVALAVGVGIAGAYAGSAGGLLGGLVGFCAGVAGGGWIGLWLGAYVLIATPVIVGLFGAYHGGVHGTQFGIRAAERSGAVVAGLRLGAVAGFFLGAGWIALLSLTQRHGIPADLLFLALSVSIGSLAIGLLGLLGALAVCVGDERTHQVMAAKRWLSAVIAGSALFFFWLPSRASWLHMTIPPGLFQNWTATLSHGSPSTVVPPPVSTRPALSVPVATTKKHQAAQTRPTRVRPAGSPSMSASHGESEPVSSHPHLRQEQPHVTIERSVDKSVDAKKPSLRGDSVLGTGSDHDSQESGTDSGKPTLRPGSRLGGNNP